MKSRFLFFVALALSVTLAGRAQQENPWDRYKPRTLQSIIEMHRNDLDKVLDPAKDQTFVTADSFPSRTNLVFLAESRPLSSNKKELLNEWAKAMNQPAKVLDVFATEMLFKEGAKEHWIAVQKPLLDPIRKEVKPGQSLDAYVIFIGTTKKVSADREWLFAMNEFDKP